MAIRWPRPSRRWPTGTCATCTSWPPAATSRRRARHRRRCRPSGPARPAGADAQFHRRQCLRRGNPRHRVAGIIAARADDGVGIAGIAPGARLLGLRACSQLARGGAACSSFSLAKALQFALEAKAQVFNLSLTGPPDRLLARLLDVAMARGASVVGAVDVDAADGGFPASHPGVLAVAGLQSPRARPGDVLPSRVLRAPDRGIPAPRPGGGWDLVSGTSYAAAQVSGLVALLRELSPRLGAPTCGPRCPPFRHRLRWHRRRLG